MREEAASIKLRFLRAEAGLKFESRRYVAAKLAESPPVSQTPRIGKAPVLGHIRLLTLLASSAWGFAGASKLVSSTAISVSGVHFGIPYVIALGVLELGIAVAWWVGRIRIWAAVASLLAAASFAGLVLAGIVDPKSCACFGGLKVEKARHLAVLAGIIIVSALSVLLESRRHDHVTNQA